MVARSVVRGLLFGFSLLALSACGGGGGGVSQPAVTYNGSTGPATLSSAAPDSLALDAYHGGDLAGGLVAPLAADAGPAGEAVVLGKLFEDLATTLPWVPQVSPLATTTSTETGPCGGSAQVNVTQGSTSSVVGLMTFSGYCSNNVTLNGTFRFSGTVNPQTDDASLRMRFDGLSVDSLVSSGTIQVDFNLSSTTAPMTTSVDMVLEDSATGKGIWLNNYLMTLVPGSSSDQLSVSGRYYDHDRGYVDFTTPVAFDIDGAGIPQSGTMHFVGSTGTSADLQATGAGGYQLTVTDSAGSLTVTGLF